MLLNEHTQVQDRDSNQWLEYFQENNDNLRQIPWGAGAELTESERRAIQASVQIFQLGERSEGKHLARCAREHAESTNDLPYYDAIKLFIKEEQRHARDLGRFMQLNGIAIIKKIPTDSVFRWLRHLANLEMSVSILVAAEIIAQVYYPALREATNSKILIALCDQIIDDEDDHVSFQAQRLAILRKRRPGVMSWMTEVIYRVFFDVTSRVVWFGHRPVFQAAGQTYGDYRRACRSRLNSAMLKMRPSYWKVTR